MKYATLCSGIEAVSMALRGLDAEPVFFADIEPFPKALLAHRYPDVPELGDMTAWREWDEDLLAQVELIVAGTPCQAFSLAGGRASLDDDRGNLTLQFVEIINAIDNLRRNRGKPPITVVWENVPGVLSVRDNAFGCFLAGLVGSDTAIDPERERGWTGAGVVSGPRRTAAWRILDAQYFGLAQRRRRIFVVASAGNGTHPAALLLESEGVRRDSPPRRQEGAGIARRLTAGTGGVSGGEGLNQLELEEIKKGKVARSLVATNTASGYMDASVETYVPVGFNWANGGGYGNANDGLGIAEDQAPPHTCSQVAAVAIAENVRGEVRQMDIPAALTNGGGKPGQGYACVFKPYYFTRVKDGAPTDLHPPLSAEADKGDQEPVLYSAMPMNSSTDYKVRATDVAQPLTTRPGSSARQGGDIVGQAMAVRRLTPIECERLQGFPDGYTKIPYRGKPAEDCPDGPRYRALGNSMAVPVMRFILSRIVRNPPWDDLPW